MGTPMLLTSYPPVSSSSSRLLPAQYSNLMVRSPSGNFMHPPTRNHPAPSRISKSCENVSISNFSLKPSIQFEQNQLPDIDAMMSPASPMRVDMCETEDLNSADLFQPSSSIPIPSLNAQKSETLGWLDLSMSPTYTSAGTSPVSSVSSAYKETPPISLYDSVIPFRSEETFSLSLFDLDTPTALHAPTDFPEAMETGFV